MKKIFFGIVILFSFYESFSQASCAGAAPFCTGTTYNFPATVTGTNAPAGPDYGCLLTQPDPVWYYLQIASNGTIVMNIAGANAGDDIDFCCWGPFTSATGGCAGGLTANCPAFFGCESNTSPTASYPAGNMIDCSYDPQAQEICTIPNAVAGQFYMVLITNYGGTNTNIVFNQTNTGAPGAGSTNCNILCNITSMNATPGACQPATNTYDVTGTINTSAPPSSGTLTITNSCGGSTVLNPPFTAVTNYTITGCTPTGGSCTITAAYSADPTCTYTVNINSPAPCVAAACAISSVTANPGACIPASNTFDVSGNVSFSNPPASGTLTITNSCGGSQVFNPPFVSPINYTITSIPSNGAACTITASFSASAGCTNTVNYNAPASCATCNVTAGNDGPVCENQSLNLSCSLAGATSYSWAGPNGFSSNVQNPTIPSSTLNHSGTYTVTVNMPGGAVCNATTVVVINPIPIANAGADVSICLGDNTVLNGSGGGTYSWLPVTGLSNPGISNPSASPTSATNYTLTVTNNGCTSTDVITVSVITVVTANASNDTSICSGQSTQLNAAGGSTYSWSPASGLSNPGIAAPIASPLISTTYTVIVSAGGSCPTDTEYVSIAVNPVPSISVSPAVTVCQGNFGVLQATGATLYNWMGTGITNDSIISNPSVTTTYTVIGYIGTCSDTAQGQIIVLPPPDPEFIVNGQQEAGEYTVGFQNVSMYASNYTWTFPDGFIPSTQNFEHTFASEGAYQVCLRAENSLGCYNDYCQVVVLKPDWNVYIPNAFSPDNDGLNDSFYVVGNNITKFEMAIFNRWGEVVYKSNNINEGWDGSKNNSGKTFAGDTFIYKVKISDVEGRYHNYVGHVTVVR